MLCTLSNQQPQSSKRTIFTRKQMLPSKSSEATAAPFSLLTSKTSGLGSQSQLHQKSSSLDVEEGSLKSKVKYLWKTYGIIAIGTYFGIYVTTLSSIFVSLDFDVFNAASVGLDPVGAVQKARTLFVASFFFNSHFLFLLLIVLQVCDIFEAVTGNGALPNYIRENPRGKTMP